MRGALIALPLVEQRQDRSSLAIGAALAVGFVELLVDAVPGIVLRLETHLMLPHFGVDRPPWSPGWLADQQAAGAILWTVAEVLDLPFLVIVIMGWMHADAREARRMDEELDRQAARAVGPAGVDAPAGQSATQPWWLADPQLRRRFGAD